MGIGVPLQHGGSNATDGGITKLGSGTLTLSGANTYTGDTTVSAGSLVLASGGSTLMNINNSSAPYSQFLGNGSIDLEGMLDLNLTAVTSSTDRWQLVANTLASTTYGSSFTIETSTGGIFFGSGGVLGYIDGSHQWTFTEASGVLALVTVVPEPSTLALLTAGAIGLLAYGWRRRRA